MDNNTNEPEYIRRIREEAEHEMAKEREGAAREVDRFHLSRARADGEPAWDHVVVAQNLALLHEGLMEWVGLMDEDILVLLHLSTVARGCLVRANEQTGEYESALIFLTCEDDLVVMADTADESIMAGTEDRMVVRLNLPYVDLIQREIRRYYDIARSARKLETIAAPTGELVKVLFANNFC